MGDGWTQAEAIALCRKIEDVCPAFGCHVALTGGVLYKLGERKDLGNLAIAGALCEAWKQHRQTWYLACLYWEPGCGRPWTRVLQ